mmetsp:Transcript_29198/g.62891  ORF Transcript_29198/g.62891 Transcript_29198/m.62891 type:complete len:253 (+) Transcript_29198:459-1217(+)
MTQIHHIQRLVVQQGTRQFRRPLVRNGIKPQQQGRDGGIRRAKHLEQIARPCIPNEVPAQIDLLEGGILGEGLGERRGAHVPNFIILDVQRSESLVVGYDLGQILQPPVAQVVPAHVDGGQGAIVQYRGGQGGAPLDPDPIPPEVQRNHVLVVPQRVEEGNDVLVRQVRLLEFDPDQRGIVARDAFEQVLDLRDVPRDVPSALAQGLYALLVRHDAFPDAVLVCPVLARRSTAVTPRLPLGEVVPFGISAGE